MSHSSAATWNWYVTHVNGLSLSGIFACPWLYARGPDHLPRAVVTIPRDELGGIPPPIGDR